MDKKEKRYCLIDHANKRSDKLRKNPNRASLQAARSRRVLPSELGRDDVPGIDEEAAENG